MKFITKHIEVVAALALSAVFLGLMFLTHYQSTSASIALDAPSQENRFRVYDLFASTTAETTVATSTTATSTNIVAYADASGRIINGSVDLRGAKKASFYFTRTGVNGNTGTSTFSVQISRDGTNYNNYSKLISNVTNTNAQTLTRVASVALGNDMGTGTSTSVVGLDLSSDAFYSARCVVFETIDGEHACAAAVQY